VNCTDGRYVYMRGPASQDNTPLYNYTLMPTHMRRTFSVEEIHRMEGLQAPFSFTKGCQTMKIKSGKAWVAESELKTMLFDTLTDPGQKTPLHDQSIEEAMTRLLVQVMKANDAPPEQFVRLGLEPAH
jgi:hypothetical protein